MPNRLASLEQLKEYVGSGDTSSMDELLGRLLDAASAAIEAEYGVFTKVTNTAERYDGNGASALVLRHTPVVSVASVVESGMTLVVSEDPTTDPDVILDKDRAMLIKPFGMWFPYRRSVSVTYDSGYATIPPPVVQATLDLAALWHRERDRIGITSKNIADQQVQFRRTMPDDVRRALEPYRDHARCLA